MAEKLDKSTAGQSDEDTKKNKKLVIIIAILVILALVGGCIVFAITKLGSKEEETTKGEKASLGIEAGVILPGDENQSIERVTGAAASFTTWYKRSIIVTKGKQASCFIGNSESNYYDNMYFQILLTNEDGSAGDEIYLSGIIPRGGHVEQIEFKSSLDPGSYTGMLVMVCLDDEEVIINNTSVVVDIIVYD